MIASSRRFDTLEPMRQRIANACETFGSEGEHLRETAVVGRGFQILERLDAEVVIDAIGQSAADTGNRGEKLCRIALAAQPLEHRQPAVLDDITNRAGDADADAGQRLQTFKTLLAENIGDRLRQAPDGSCRALIGAHAERIRALGGEQPRDFFEPPGDAFVQAARHVPVTNAYAADAADFRLRAACCTRASTRATRAPSSSAMAASPGAFSRHSGSAAIDWKCGVATIADSPSANS